MITEADVIAFLTERAAELSAQTGEPYCSVTLEVLNASHGRPARITWKTYVVGDTHRTASTLDEVMNASVRAMRPDVRAEELRKQAEKLLAEANALLSAPQLSAALK